MRIAVLCEDMLLYQSTWIACKCLLLCPVSRVEGIVGGKCTTIAFLVKSVGCPMYPKYDANASIGDWRRLLIVPSLKPLELLVLTSYSQDKPFMSIMFLMVRYNIQN